MSPALSKNPVPEIFRHFCFNGDSVMAFNDQIAISTELPGNTFHGALPKILLKLLNTIDSDEITLEPDGVDRCTVNWNSSDLKLITLPPSEFLFLLDA